MEKVVAGIILLGGYAAILGTIVYLLRSMSNFNSARLAEYNEEPTISPQSQRQFQSSLQQNNQPLANHRKQEIKNQVNLVIKDNQKALDDINFDPKKIPSQYICSITLAVMNYAVTAEDGQSYEKEAIRTWLMKCKRSPNKNINMGDIITPNENLQSLIDDFVANAKKEYEASKKIPAEIPANYSSSSSSSPLLFKNETSEKESHSGKLIEVFDCTGPK